MVFITTPQEQYPQLHHEFLSQRGEFVSTLQEGVAKVIAEDEAYFFVETKTARKAKTFVELML